MAILWPPLICTTNVQDAKKSAWDMILLWLEIHVKCVIKYYCYAKEYVVNPKYQILKNKKTGILIRLSHQAWKKNTDQMTLKSPAQSRKTQVQQDIYKQLAHLLPQFFGGSSAATASHMHLTPTLRASPLHTSAQGISSVYDDEPLFSTGQQSDIQSSEECELWIATRISR